REIDHAEQEAERARERMIAREEAIESPPLAEQGGKEPAAARAARPSAFDEIAAATAGEERHRIPSRGSGASRASAAGRIGRHVSSASKNWAGIRPAAERMSFVGHRRHV